MQTVGVLSLCLGKLAAVVVLTAVLVCKRLRRLLLLMVGGRGVGRWWGWGIGGGGVRGRGVGGGGGGRGVLGQAVGSASQADK